MKTKFLLVAILFIAIAVQFGTGMQSSAYDNKLQLLIQPPQGDHPQRTPEERAKHETEWMKTDLKLTDAQISLVDSINLKYAKKQTELRNQMQGQDREAMISKRQELQTQKNEELKKILSEDQMKKYLELLEQRRASRGPRPEQPKQ